MEDECNLLVLLSLVSIWHLLLCLLPFVTRTWSLKVFFQMFYQYLLALKYEMSVSYEWHCTKLGEAFASTTWNSRHPFIVFPWSSPGWPGHGDLWWSLVWCIGDSCSVLWQGVLLGILVLRSVVPMVTSPLVVRVSSASSGLLVTPPLIVRMSLALGLLISDSSCVHGESTSTSAGASASDSVSLSSLEGGRGMDR